MKRASIALVCIGALFACHEKTAVLAPDLVVDFGCAANPEPKTVQAFLMAHSFSSVDEEEARRKNGKTFFSLQIDAYSRHRLMIEVIGLRRPKSYGSGVDYRLSITSPPPTTHDRSLEEDAIGLVRDTLRCQLHAVNRYENGADSVGLFNSVFEDVQRRMREASSGKI